MRKVLTLLLFFVVSLISYAGDMDVKVYKGTSRYNSDVICTVRDGKIYKNTSVYTSDIVCTVRKDQVYKGTSPYRSDIRFSFDGFLTIEEFVAVWHTVLYVY